MMEICFFGIAPFVLPLCSVHELSVVYGILRSEYTLCRLFFLLEMCREYIFPPCSRSKVTNCCGKASAEQTASHMTQLLMRQKWKRVKLKIFHVGSVLPKVNASSACHHHYLGRECFSADILFILFAIIFLHSSVKHNSKQNHPNASCWRSILSSFISRLLENRMKNNNIWFFCNKSIPCMHRIHLCDVVPTNSSFALLPELKCCTKSTQ